MKKPTKPTPRQRELKNRKRAAKKHAGAQLRQGGKPSADHGGKGRPARPGSSRATKAAKNIPQNIPAGLPEGWKGGAASSAEKAQPRMLVADIKVGERHRKDMGDIAALARDFNERGLLQPIVVDRDGSLIAGERRLQAWQHPDHVRRGKPIPVHVVPLADIVAGEWAENDPALRKDFLPSEAVAIKRAIEAKLAPAAAERQRAGKKGERGEATRSGAQAAAFTGKSRRTVEKAEAIVEAAEADPARFGKLKENMDKTGRVDGPFKQLQALKQADAIRSAPAPLPGNGPYGAGVFDCAWAAEPDDDDPERLNRGYYPYPTMTPAQFAQFCGETAGPLLHDDFIGAFWITNFHLVRGDHLPALQALKLEPVALLTWVKDRVGRGQVARGTTEHVIIARRGKTVIETPFPSTYFGWPVDRKHHSRKPQAFFDLFAKHVPAARYVSFFETVDRGETWDGYGDKAPAKLSPAELADEELKILDAAESGQTAWSSECAEKLRTSGLIAGTVKWRVTKKGKERLHTLRAERDLAERQKEKETSDHGRLRKRGEAIGHSISITMASTFPESPVERASCSCGSWQCSLPVDDTTDRMMATAIEEHLHAAIAADPATRAEAEDKTARRGSRRAKRAPADEPVAEAAA